MATSKSDKIRDLLKTGMSATDIAKNVGCKRKFVYNVKSRVKARANRAPKKRGRPADPNSMSGKFRKMLKKGMSALDIAKKLRCAPKLIGNVKWRVKHGTPKQQHILRILRNVDWKATTRSEAQKLLDDLNLIRARREV